MPRQALSLLAALLALPAAVRAQTVVGEVVDAGAGGTLANAVVVLVDSTQARRGGVLTDSAGRFVLGVPASGTWTVRAERVGSLSASSEPLTLAAGDTARVRLVLGAAARLSAVRVTARERCRVRPAEGEAAARLWDEARKALVGTTLGDASRGVRLGRFTREIEADRRTVRREVWSLAPTGVQAFRSMDVADLGTRGFVEPAMSAAGGDSVVYYAPDAEVLLSDAFLESHCLRAVPPTPGRAGQLGVAIEPVPRRGEKRADVRGTLWVDTASFELREFEFEYVDLPPNVPPGRASGMVGFARRPDGSWYVDRWMITMPVEEVTTVTRPGATSLHNLHARDVVEQHVTSRATEIGGRTIVPGAVRRGRPTVLAGRLIDSTAGGTPVADGRVLVLGTPYQAQLSDSGEFYLEVQRAGDYMVRVEAPRAASLGLGWTQLLALSPGRELRIEAAIPSTATLRQLHCTGAAATDSAPALILGVVRAWHARRRGETPALRAMPDVAVEVEWREPAWPADWKERRTVRTDARGIYRLCDLPPDADVVLRARRTDAASEPWSGRAARGAVVTADLQLAPVRVTSGRFD